MLKILGGIDKIYKGEIEINKISIYQTDINKSIGLVLDEIEFYTELSVKENINFCASAYKISSKQIQIKTDWFSNFFDFEKNCNKNISNCSSKELYLIKLFIALLHSPNLLILDNPYSHFAKDDFPSLNTLFNNLISKKITIIYSTETLRHDLIYDRVCKLQKVKTALTFTKKEILEKNTE